MNDFQINIMLFNSIVYDARSCFVPSSLITARQFGLLSA